MRKVICLLLLLNFSYAKAQLWINDIDKFPDLKTKGVFVVMTDTTSPVNNTYWNIYKKYWTYSPVHFVSYQDMDKYIEPGNYFFTLIRNNRIDEKKRNVYWEEVYHCSLTLWEHKGKNKPNLKEDILNGNVHVTDLLGEYLFSTEEKSFYAGDYKLNGGPDVPKLNFYTECNYDGINKNGKNLYFNWCAGLLKNYLQSFVWYIEQHKYILEDSDDEIFEKDKMEALKQDTLFVPEFAFEEYALSNTNKEIPLLVTKKTTKADIAKEKQNIKLIFRRYKHPYKVISAQELNHKLLHDTKPFSYLMYVVYEKFKQITIMNSATGENIYYTYSPKRQPTDSDINGKLTSEIRNIKLLPEDIDILANKMDEKK